MAKKKKKKAESKIIEMKGTPTVLLLPARNYRFRVHEEEYAITVPRKGSFKELAPEFYKDDDSEFDFLQYDKDHKNMFIPMPIITHVLFATAQYPDLKDDQAFVLSGIIIEDDKVKILGKLVDMIEGEQL